MQSADLLRQQGPGTGNRVLRCAPITTRQAAADGGAAIPEAGAGKAAVVDAVAAWVEAAIAADRKVGLPAAVCLSRCCTCDHAPSHTL